MSITKNGITYRVADAHTHVYPSKIAEKATRAIGDFYELDMDNVGLPSVLHKTGGDAGIDRFLIFSVATKLEQMRPISEFIARQCRKNPDFTGIGAWHQDAVDIDAEFDHIMELGLRGIKLHADFQHFNIDEPHMLDVYREAQRRGLVVLFHMGDDRTDYSSPERLARILEQFPEFRCIAAHLGGYQQWALARELLHGANVYTDCSSSLFFLSPEEARESIAHFGTDRTMFGTDFPMWEPAQELERFFALGLPPEENKRILYDNFAALLRLE